MNPHFDTPLSFENPGALRRTREEYKADLLVVLNTYPDMWYVEIANRLQKDPWWTSELLREIVKERDAVNNIGAFI